MNKKRLFYLSLIAAFAIILVAGTALAADDGPLFGRNVSRTPHTMTGASSMSVMPLYVPAQDTQGECADTNEDGTCGIDYYAGDCSNQDTSTCELIYTRTEAKPLIITYNDGMIEEELPAEVLTGAGFGERDAFAGLSLDDGATWKNYNLSDSALRSSFVLKNGHDYAGDVFKMVHQVEGNKVVAAWISRYCESGAPLYSWLEDEKDGLLLAYPELLKPINVDGGTDPDGYYEMYVDDLFTVGGTQQSVDYALQGFPEVGEVPYGCVWVARGSLEQDLDESGNPLFNSVGDPIYDIVWRASERLTSGRRDPHQINITSSPGAGFIIEWQEDPDGLRPGKGLGPGEGWSGAIANSKTDLWYTYIDLAHFDAVCTDDVDDVYCTPGTLADFNATELFGMKPKAAVPFAMPIRLTDNSQCKMPQKLDTNGDLLNPYCYADFNGNSVADFCATQESWTNPGGTSLEVCVAEDGRHMTGRTASTRVRMAMKSYDSDGDGAPDSAWVLLGEEKMKALGTLLDEYLEPEDIGKNMWYHTFEFDQPEIMGQGLMLNAPALSPETGEYIDLLVDEWGYDLYDTEIARRFNLFVNSAPVAMASDSRTMGLLIYKEGIINQGGPADIFIRRLVLPVACLVDEITGDIIDDGTCFNPSDDNPFAYENVQCVAYDDYGVATPVELFYADGLNPNYLRGLCPNEGMNISGTTIQMCDDGSSGEACADQFPFSLTYEEWFGGEDVQIPKVTEWVQAPDNYNDPSWANPYDVSKGHRGFIDGDFIMMMYATAPNWKAGTVGNEAYNLYIRRSFDGGVTWTTLPADYTHWDGTTMGDLGVTADGTTTCEDWGWGGILEYESCTTYAAGEFEQARNVSRLTGNKVTVLDPRYSPSGGMLKESYKNLLCDPELDNIWTSCGYTDDASAPYPEEIRDPSTFFATFETGDNTVVNVETGANPLDMYYSRASNFGDDWDEQDACIELDDPWYPNANVTCEEGETELRWDWLENGDDWATEASVFGNPSGDRFYAVWNQELPVDVDAEIYTDMDSEFRRVFFNLTADTTPTASLLGADAYFLSIAEGDSVILEGVAIDRDHLGEGQQIINHMWFDENGAIYCEIDDYDDDGNPIYECEKDTEVKAADMTPGKHQIKYKGQDNEGNWSKADSVDIYVFTELHQVFLPVAVP